MNPEDSIKNFFQKRLKETTPIAEDWNTPSEDIWEKAKVEFPKEDKSRKPFLFMLIGLIGFILAGFIGYTQFNNNTEQRLTENIETIESDNLVKTDIQKAQTSLTQESASETLVNKLSDSKSKTNSINTQAKNSSRSAVDQNNYSKNIASNSSTIKEDKKVLSFSNTSALTETKRDDQLDLKSNSTAVATSNSNSTADSAYTPNSSIPNVITTADKVVLLKDENDLLQLNELDKNPIDFLNYDMTEGLSADHIITPLKNTKKWEIGVSTSPLVLPLLKFIEEDSASSQITDLEFNYFGLNIPVTRILNEKWSLTSGLYFKTGSFGAKFSEEETLDIGDNISLMLDDQSADASITLDENTQEIIFTLKPDEEIRDGDKIRGDGSGKFKFNVFQIPLLANYHIRKNRLEYLFTFGPSLDIAHVEISEFDLTLSKENRIISEPISFNPMSQYYFEYGINVGIGTKFHFNENTNLSYTLKTDLTAIILATHEIGLHYRF